MVKGRVSDCPAAAPRSRVVAPHLRAATHGKLNTLSGPRMPIINMISHPPPPLKRAQARSSSSRSSTVQHVSGLRGFHEPRQGARSWVRVIRKAPISRRPQTHRGGAHTRPVTDNSHWRNSPLTKLGPRPASKARQLVVVSQPNAPYPLRIALYVGLGESGRSISGVCLTQTPVLRFGPASCYEKLCFDL